jgi:hypothetical protein
MQALLGDLPFVRVYLDNILVLTEATFSDHIEELEHVFIRLKSAGLQCNAPKCKFTEYETEYLGYNLTQSGIQPIVKKLKQFNPSQSRRARRNFVASLDYATTIVTFGLNMLISWHQ